MGPIANHVGHTFRALRNRDYGLYFSGQLVSNIGGWMQQVAQAWLVYRLTQSTGMLGLATFLAQGPFLFLSPMAGAIADRTSRRAIFIGTQWAGLLVAAGLSALGFLGSEALLPVFVLISLQGVITVFDITSRQAYLREIVGLDDLPNAVALNATMINGSRFIGPAVAGPVIALGGESWCFAINAATYLIVLGCVALIAPPPPASQRGGSLLDQMMEGFAYALQNRTVRALSVIAGCTSLFGMPYQTLLPSITVTVLDGGPRLLGWLMSAGGFGAVVGALVLAGRRNLRGSVAWIVTGMTGFGVALVVLAVSRHVAITVIAIALAGFTQMIQTFASYAVLQAMVPDALRARLLAVFSAVQIGLIPFGTLTAGLLAERFGAQNMIAWGGVICGCVGALAWRAVPGLRDDAQRRISERRRSEAA